MAIKIGCPAVKLVTARGKNAGKRSAKLQGVLCEGWECGVKADGTAYRMCHDADYNPALTAQNVYVGERNAYRLGAAIQSEAMEYSARRKAAGKRAMRSTAAIGYSIILKPPAEYVNGLDKAEQARLAQDLLDAFRVATADFIAEDAINAVWQVDEAGGHWHIAGPAKTPAGDIDADAIVNPRLYTALNRVLPNEMRQRKWDVVECVNYDPDAVRDMDADEKAAYKAEAKARRPTAGKDSRDFKAQRDAARLAELEKLEAWCKATKYRNGCSLYEHFKTGKITPAVAHRKPAEAVQAKPKASASDEAGKPSEAPQRPSTGVKSFEQMKAERDAATAREALRSTQPRGFTSPEAARLAEQFAARKGQADALIADIVKGDDDSQRTL